MNRADFAKPYLVALYREHRRNRDVPVTVSELTQRYDVPRDSYLDDEVAEYFQIHGWAQAAAQRAIGEGPSDQPISISGNGKMAAEELIAQGIDPHPLVLGSGSSGGYNLETTSGTIPAADRIVSLTHNQIVLVEQPLSSLILEVEQSNGISDEPTFRQRIIGQLKASRELIRVGEVKWIILQMTLFAALEELIDRYKDGVIAGLATELLITLGKSLLG